MNGCSQLRIAKDAGLQAYAEPSDGLEPETPSLRHARRISKFPTSRICRRNCVARDRPCTRVTPGNLRGF